MLNTSDSVTFKEFQLKIDLKWLFLAKWVENGPHATQESNEQKNKRKVQKFNVSKTHSVVFLVYKAEWQEGRDQTCSNSQAMLTLWQYWYIMYQPFGPRMDYGPTERQERIDSHANTLLFDIANELTSWTNWVTLYELINCQDVRRWITPTDWLAGHPTMYFIDE